MTSKGTKKEDEKVHGQRSKQQQQQQQQNKKKKRERIKQWVSPIKEEQISWEHKGNN